LEIMTLQNRLRKEKTQAAVGFEPTNNGFANRRLRPLGYAALRNRPALYTMHPTNASRILPDRDLWDIFIEALPKPPDASQVAKVNGGWP
jgi:hypothetical protein